MTYACRVRVSYGSRATRLERLRAMDARYEQLTLTCDASEQLWAESSQSLDERRDACTAIAVAMSTFALDAGVQLYAKERVNDLLVALGELQCGRKSVLLSPAPVHPGKFSASDLMQQAIAQVCVDMLRSAGASATDARKQVAHAFAKHKLPKFSEAKLRGLNSRLKGPGSSEDEAYGMYQWAKNQAASTGSTLGLWPIQSRTKASKLIDTLVSLAKRRDHRREDDFFFAPDENSSAIL